MDKQREVKEKAKKLNTTIPQDLINTWEQAYALGGQGEEAYKEFLKKWNEIEKRSENHTHNQGEAQPGAQPEVQPPPQQQPPNNGNQNYNGNNYNQPPQNYQQNQNGYRGNRYNPNQYYPNNRNQYNNPYQNYNRPQQNNYQPNQYNGPQNNMGGYQPYQPDNNGRPEPMAGQQVNKWQQMLLDTQKEITQWGQKNNIEVGADVIQLWNNAMQRGDEDSYNQFLRVWNQIKSNPEQYKNSTATPEAWKVAVVNQIEAQSALATNMGIDMDKELYALRDRAIKADGTTIDSILESVTEIWKRLNTEIEHRTKPKATTT